MEVRESGLADAPPVLLLHGGGVAGWMWRPTLAALRTPVRAIVPDLPGHGASASDDYRSHGETVTELERLLEQRAPAGATVVGFSLGAQLAVLLAARRPELVADVVVVSAQAKSIAMPQLTLAMLAAAAPLAKWRRFARLQAKELFVPAALMPEYLADSARITKATLLASVGENLRFTVPPGWARSGDAGPTSLVVVGSRERALMRDSARVLHESRPGSGLRIVEGVGHGLPLQRPDDLARLIDQRLARTHPSG
ncbi:alpha/beta hydrolase [Agrococcus sp. ARC_14]|uniref:alpha/beta fold hydrolase n=1 Tax=Agrococcus sp. ARC_14 TaxID=2919927 RepID=UPI001F05D37F|nr:alpha/beta hydrolase [Agrococcus sp. ARC_14]MCH1882955.1 alpha/beta hydrolase [Agrococcus sp. ARC_14]